MAQEATEVYQEYIRDTTFMDESMVNRIVESGHEAPFRPAIAEFPVTDADRRAILDESDATRTGPIIIAPSGMLTGGNSALSNRVRGSLRSGEAAANRLLGEKYDRTNASEPGQSERRGTHVHD